ncbi:MAG: TatD family hydrolase [bacterium]|nr:TatD family hydrolase [bacterium]
MKLFDSHAHVGAPDLLAEAPAILERARQAGVVGVIAIGAGYGVGANAGAVSLAQEQAGVWATTGVHPHDANEWSEISARAIDGWCAHEKVVAVGECGLDYWYEHSPREAQAECLRGQIQLAHRRQLPLVIHVRPSRDTRDAFDDILRIFDEENADRAGGVIHCFSGDQIFADDCLARGFDIGFSGIVTFKSAEDLREVARQVPPDRILIETDSPLLAPVPHRGKRNEPAWVGRVAECLAETLDCSAESIAERTTATTCRAFALEPPA